jgi:hypothetical protein
MSQSIECHTTTSHISVTFTSSRNSTGVSTSAGTVVPQLLVPTLTKVTTEVTELNSVTSLT